MLCTEKQAKTKWCSEARVFIVDCDCDIRGFSTTAVNRCGDMDEEKFKETEWTFNRTRCLASGCMKWVEVEGTDKGYCGLSRG